MGLIFELEESEYSGPIDDDTVMAAECLEIKQKEMPWDTDAGVPDKKIEFKFVVTEDGPHQGRFLWGKTSTKFNNNPNCKLYAWSQEIAATEFPIGYKMDTDILIGQPCRVVVGYREYEKDGMMKGINEVKDCLRSREAMAAGDPF